MKAKAYWHIHHDKLIEYAIEDIRRRREYIKKYKPENEVKLRLKLLNPVRGELPEEVVKTREALVKAWEAEEKALVKAREAEETALVKAWEAEMEACEAWEAEMEAWDEAVKDNMSAILQLHDIECPNCPWDGKTIFVGGD